MQPPTHLVAESTPVHLESARLWSKPTTVRTWFSDEGHLSVIHVPKSDEYYAVYHRRPLDETDGDSRATCLRYTLSVDTKRFSRT